MVFSSHFFVYYFLPLLLVVYYNLPYRGRNVFVVFMSYAFYGWWNPWFTVLLAFSTVLNYACGRIIGAPQARRAARVATLAAAVVLDLALLGFFKYFMFFTEGLNSLMEAFGGQALPVLRVVLPIGISFYTFQAISYVVDIYRGDAKPARSLIDYACFISMFPHSIAGPIVRYHTIAEQLVAREHTVERFTSGVAMFVLGMAKKILLADAMGEIADAAFNAASPPAVDAWFGAAAYAFQIYFDFAGYSDMAVGLARLLGFELMKNFDAPYRAESITEFWRRWHVSLSTFLRDYLYIPLGGNRRGPLRTYVNLAVVMLLGGLWHGAKWNFVAWGGYHGLLLGYERWRGKTSLYSRFPRAARVAITFVLTLFSWVLFRAEDLAAAGQYLAAMFALRPAGSASMLLAAEMYTAKSLAVTAVCVILVLQPIQAFDWARQAPGWLRAMAILLLFALALAMMSTQAFAPFLYFQF
jgi:alginate O-acetyltransferase complex protein AlgI